VQRNIGMMTLARTSSRFRGLTSPVPTGATLVACALLLVVSACGKDDAATKPKPPMVVAATPAAVADYTPRLTVLGTVTPLQSVAVRSRVDGQIVSVAFTEGADVRAGQTLFKLDDRAARASVAQAAAALASAEASARQADADYKRAQSLVSSGFISGATIDQKRAAAATAEAAIGGARASLQAAQASLSYLTIAAPVSGRTGEIGFKLGATVKANDATPLVTVNQLSPITARFAVPPDRIQALRDRYRAGPVSITALDRDAGRVIATGKLVFLDNNVDASNGSIAAKAEFANADAALWPGALVNLDVPVATPRRMIRLPEAAVQNGQDFTYVWTVSPDNKATLTKVVLAGRVDGNAYIASGLAPGAMVITDALAKLRDGGKVKIKTSPQPGLPA
jgi:multidrug efflux system membrane fusion protein